MHLAVNQLVLPTDRTYARQLQAAAILEPLFETMPEHPGLAHYIIHAYDAPALADRVSTALGLHMRARHVVDGGALCASEGANSSTSSGGT